MENCLVCGDSHVQETKVCNKCLDLGYVFDYKTNTIIFNIPKPIDKNKN